MRSCVVTLNQDSSKSDGDDRDWPFVSVVMPVRNERPFIAKCVQQMLDQDYPRDKFEIVVADGLSDDGTLDILADIAAKHPQVRVIENPGRIVSTGLNLAIQAARGEIILRLDGHAEVAADFMRQDVLLLAEHAEAWSVGGPIHHTGRTAFGRAVAIAMSHPCGVGNARHRFPDFEGYVEGAQFPAIRRWVFDRVGFFDESLVRNQDDEFNFRMAQAGGKVFVSPRVKYVYYVRESLGKLARQYFQYGYWRIPVMRKHRRPTTLRQLAPPLFFLVMGVLAVIGVWLRSPLVGFALPLIYAAILIAVGLSAAPKAGLAVALRIPVALATMHLAYAWGECVGFAAMLFRRDAWDTQGKMARLSR